MYCEGEHWCKGVDNGNWGKKAAVAKKKEANKEKDTVPSGVCRMRCCGDKYKRKWIQSQQCLVWFHYDCQGLDDKARKPVRSFICVSCADGD